jgi:hypothetical protein
VTDWYSWYSIFKARETDMRIRLKHPRVKKVQPHPGRLALGLLLGGHMVGEAETIGGIDSKAPSCPHV